jgi:hypothetical protein
MTTFSPRPAPVKARRALTLAAFGAATILVGLAAACSGLTSIDASFENVTDTVDFYPINDSPPGAPTAISLFTGLRARADQSFSYDLAFDLTPEGAVKLIPARALASAFGGANSVGLQKISDAPFSTVVRAPKDGYVVDSTMTVGPGTVVVIQSFDLARCGGAIKGQSFFSKIVVKSVDPATRKISTVLTIDRNCGFRSFAEGKPKD